jgi:hypothetical protein
MGAPHNKNRYGEKWNEVSTSILMLELCHFQRILGSDISNMVISGGWAWCLMSPRHTEYKHAHDLKDIDLMVNPNFFGVFHSALELLEYKRDHTKYDKLSPFYRYSKMVQGIGCSASGSETIERKIILDVFLQEVPSVLTEDYFYVVEPSVLASFYGMYNPDSLIHGSGQCWSLAIAKELMANGESPLNHREMANFQTFLNQKS